MVRFKVFDNGGPAKALNLRGACLLGSDRVPIRADLKYHGGQLICEPRERGAVALSILWSVQDMGRMVLETPRLLERQEPYNLHVELARGQLMRISQKREDWGLYDYEPGAAVYGDVDAARELLIAALTSPDGPTAARHADAALVAGVKAGESVGALHADVFLKRRRPVTSFARRPLGCRLPIGHCDEPHLKLLSEALDFACVPFDWKTTEPQSGKFASAAIEPALAALKKNKIRVHAASLFSFDPGCLPDWLPSKVKSYDQLRDAIVRHVRQLTAALAPHVRSWEAAIGLNAANPFKLSYSQIVELTRVVAMCARQAAHRVPVIVTISQPWGEYYAANPQTIQPMLYAETIMQTGVAFDAFGLDLRFGGPSGGAVRDMMQVSSLLDRMGNLGKPLHVTAAGVPSSDGTQNEGCWHGEWSPRAQAQWLREFYRIALSKPFVETVTWRTLVDSPAASDLSGLVGLDLAPKPAFGELVELRRELTPPPSNAEPIVESPEYE